MRDGGLSIVNSIRRCVYIHCEYSTSFFIRAITVIQIELIGCRTSELMI